MSQVGLNMGARHARCFGHAQSFKTHLNLTDDEKSHYDEDVIAAATFFWCLLKTLLPSEFYRPAEDALADLKLPSIATKHVSPGACTSRP